MKEENVKRHRKMAVYKPREKPGTDPSLTAFRRNQACSLLDLRHLLSRTGGQYILVFQPLVQGTLFWQPKQTKRS